MRSLPLENQEVEAATLAAWAEHAGRRVHESDLRAALGRGSLPEAFAEIARQRSSLVAITVAGETVTHGDLDWMASRAASSLARFGVGADRRVMLIAEIGIEEIAAYLGVLRLGATLVLANPSLTESELAKLARASEASLIVGSDAGLRRVVGAELPVVEEIVGLRASDSDSASAMLGDVADHPLHSVVPIDSDSSAVLAFTSGTTGLPKPTPLTHRNLLASIRGVMMAWRWGPQDHLLHSLPISHQHGLSGLHATLLAGSRCTLLGAFDPESTLDTIMNDGATVHFGVPTVYQRLLVGLGTRAVELSRLRLATSGSGPLPEEIEQRYHAVVGQRLLERYGTTESGLDVSNPYEGRRVGGQVGLPLPGVEIALVDPSGEIVEGGEVGEVLVRGPQVFSGYIGLPDSKQPFLGDWFRTGDLGVLDPETGYLRIVGRTKEVIITGGMNVYPREVEDVLLSHPDVDDVAVVGADSNRWGEEVVAVVSPANLDPTSLIRFAARRLAPYKRPKRVVAVDRVPRNSVGKPDREAIVALVPPVGV